MRQVSELSPELARGVLLLARALLAATRNWTLYPVEHPTVAQSVARLADAVREATATGALALGITPETLLINGLAADRTNPIIAEAAALLHDRDLLQITFAGEPATTTLHRLLQLLTLDATERRARGGPARIWAVEGDVTITVDEVDYRRVLEREHIGQLPEAARRDDVWRSIVVAMAAGPDAVFDAAAQARLVSVAGSVLDIRDLAIAAMTPKCTLDGSPIVTAQAAAVLAAFRHLSAVAIVDAPERAVEIMRNLASAAADLDPHVIMHLLERSGDASQDDIARQLAAAFDDGAVARLLAAALATEGHATARLAATFDTIATDPARRQRVLGLTQHLLAESDFGSSPEFPAIWQSMQELLVSYNEAPFVAAQYRASLDGLEARAEQLAAAPLPPELEEWKATLRQDRVRSQSVRLLIDLLALEDVPARAAELASDMEALAEDLLTAGAYVDAAAVVDSLARTAGHDTAVARDACREVLDRLGDSLAMREMVAVLGELDDGHWETVAKLVRQVGPSALESIKPAVMVQSETAASARAGELIVGFGEEAVSRIAALTSDERWYVQRTAAQLLGRIRLPSAVPLLAPLLRTTELRVAQAAMTALVTIDDPTASRAIHTALRAATGARRQAIADALVADRDPRVIPTLARILDESEPIGRDHHIALQTIAALGTVGTSRAVPPLVRVIRGRSIFRRRKLRAIKERGIDALTAIATADAVAALEDAARRGDRMLRHVLARKRV